MQYACSFASGDSQTKYNKLYEPKTVDDGMKRNLSYIQLVNSIVCKKLLLVDTKVPKNSTVMRICHAEQMKKQNISITN